MKNKQEWFKEKTASVSPEIMLEIQLSADIIEPVSIKGLEVLAALNHDAKVSGTAGMTEEEIEKEITAAHAEE